ncbi:MAG: AAA family ATPase [Alphaproteobacteria bacterium]
MAKDKSKAPGQVVAFMSDAESEAVAGAVLEDLGLESVAVKRGGVAAAIEYLGNFASPKLIVVDISESDLPLSDVNALAEACEPGVEVVVVGKHNDIGLFRDLIQLGVSDYLVKPMTRELFRRSIETVRGRAQASQNIRGRTGKIIAVTGARGGVGATTIAANLGWLLAQKVGRRVAMIDLDFNYGSLSLALDQKATPGLREALENIHRVDQLFLERTLIHVDSRMALLSCEEPLDYEMKFEPRALRRASSATSLSSFTMWSSMFRAARGRASAMRCATRPCVSSSSIRRSRPCATPSACSRRRAPTRSAGRRSSLSTAAGLPATGTFPWRRSRRRSTAASTSSCLMARPSPSSPRTPASSSPARTRR